MNTIKELRALLSEASLAPWEAVKNEREAMKGWPLGYFAAGADDDGTWWVRITGRHASEGPTRGAGNDARLIAAVRNALPDLLAVCEAGLEYREHHDPTDLLKALERLR